MSRTMKSLAPIFFIAIAALGSTLKVGERAPEFSLMGDTGTSVSLKSFAGKSKVVVVFYRGYW